MAEQLQLEDRLKAAYRWDFFLSHRGDDDNVEIARNFKEALKKTADVFFDKEDIHDGEYYPVALPAALRSTLVYVFLIPHDVGTGFDYMKVEVDYALRLLRENEKTRRVVPVYLYRDEVPADPDATPFGLGIHNGFAVPDPKRDLSTARERLNNTLEYVKPREAKKLKHISGARAADAKINSNNPTDILDGMKTATGIVRWAIYTFFILLVAVTLGIIACAVLLAFTWRVLPTLIVLVLMWPALLAVFLRLVSYSLGITRQMKNGNITGG